MKRHFLFFCIILYVLLTVAAVFYGNAQAQDVPYAFPVKPGTPEWKEFQTHIQMINASQVPDAQLKNMSTEALVQTCINYPLFGDFFAYNNWQMGFKTMASHFNGLSELLDRKDLSREALLAYESMDDLGSPLAKRAYEKLRYMYIEMLLAQPGIIGALDSSDNIRLLRESNKKYYARRNSPYDFGTFKLTTVCLLMGRIINNLQNQNIIQAGNLDENEVKFIEGPGVADWSIINNIITAADKILK